MNTTVPNKKRRQHYVWRHYLSGWATNGKLWCRRNGKVFNASTENVAHERDFYRLQEMSEYDFEIVRQLLIIPLQPMLRELAEGWIPHFAEVFRLKRLYEDTCQKNPELDAALDATINNLEEELHANLERQALPFLESLRKEDASIFEDDENSIHYTHFLAAQYFRTPGILMRAVEALDGIHSFNAKASLGFIRTILSTNVAYALWSRRSTLRSTFLRAEEGGTFITGDQPIINVRAIGLAKGEQATSSEFYYPLSPALALLLDFDAGACSSGHRTLGKNEVASYNQMIVGKSHEQIYGVSQSAVENI